MKSLTQNDISWAKYLYNHWDSLKDPHTDWKKTYNDLLATAIKTPDKNNLEEYYKIDRARYQLRAASETALQMRDSNVHQAKLKSIFDTTPSAELAEQRLIDELNYDPGLAHATIALFSPWANKIPVGDLNN